jgi:hypothetical protein
MIRRRLRACMRSGAIVVAGLLTAPLNLLASTSAGIPHEASIPFAAEGGIRDWQADGTQGLWVQGNSGAWYYGRFSFPCTGLQFKEALRFKFSPGGTFDRWSEVSTREAGRCLFRSFETSAGPPVTRKKAAAVQPAPATPAPPSPAAP